MNPALLSGTFKPGQALLRIGQMLWSSDGGKLAMPKLEQMAYRCIGPRLLSAVTESPFQYLGRRSTQMTAAPALR